MIKNTDLFYKTAERFQDERAELTEKHEKQLKALDRYKGSAGYSQDVEKLQKEYEKELQVLIDKYRPDIDTILGAMKDTIGRVPMQPPTNEQLNVLQMLRMKKKVTPDDCQKVANAVRNNPFALSLVNEIARESNILTDYTVLCPRISTSEALQVVTDLQAGIYDFMNFDTKRPARTAEKYYKEAYGSSDMELPKRELFKDKEGCFYEMARLTGDGLKMFCDIVDGAEGSENAG